MVMSVAISPLFQMPPHEVRRMPYRDFVQCLVVAEIRTAEERERAKNREKPATGSPGVGSVRRPAPLPSLRRR